MGSHPLDLGGKNLPDPDTKVEVWRVLELLVQEERPRWYRHDLVRHLQYIQPGLHLHQSPSASVVSVDVRSRYEIGKIIVPINKCLNWDVSGIILYRCLEIGESANLEPWVASCLPEVAGKKFRTSVMKSRRSDESING